MKKPKVKKPVTGFRKFLKDLWEVMVERNRVHKALRLLSKQEWSIEFLTALLVRAANITNQPLEIVIVGPNGTQYIVRTADQHIPTALRDDDIFNHLDDDAKIRAYMEAIK